MDSALAALNRLRAGNRRFVTNTRGANAKPPLRPAQVADGQEPFAIILGCSDSRVPAEIIFDQGLGDLFVIRVAGNIVAPSQIGSVEYAATTFGTRLVVVMGHSQCGAIHATLEQLQTPSENRSRNLRSIVDFIRPSIESLLDQGFGGDMDTIVEKAVRANVRTASQKMRNGSEILKDLEREEGLTIVGAEYSLETGVVEFFDGVPRSDNKQ